MYKQYLLWMSKEESDALDDLSNRSGLSKANVLRKLILSKPIKEKPHADFFSLIGHRVGQRYKGSPAGL